MQATLEGDAPEDLSHAGSIVDKAIEYMMDQKISPISAASARIRWTSLRCWESRAWTE